MQWNYACRVKQLPHDSWVVRSCKWQPDQILDPSLNIVVHRQRGRPLLRWDASLASFSMAMFRCRWIDVQFNNDWLRLKDVYLRWCGVIIPVHQESIPHNRVVNARRHEHAVNVPFFHLSTDTWW